MTDEYEINKRVRLLRDHLKLGRHVFAEKTGIKKQTIESIEMERQKINGEQLKAIGEQFPEYKMWLAWGEVIPEAGQISPEMKEVSEEYQMTGYS